MRGDEITFFTDPQKLINNFISPSRTQRYKLSVRFLGQTPNHQGKESNIVNLTENESRNATLWMRSWKTAETDQWELELHIRVRPKVGSQQLATGCPESEQVMPFRCVALLSTEARSDWNLKRVSWSWSGERAWRGGAIGGTYLLRMLLQTREGFFCLVLFFSFFSFLTFIAPMKYYLEKEKRTRNETKGFLRQLPHTI